MLLGSWVWKRSHTSTSHCPALNVIIGVIAMFASLNVQREKGSQCVVKNCAKDDFWFTRLQKLLRRQAAVC
jgi:hypothetical protein